MTRNMFLTPKSLIVILFSIFVGGLASGVLSEYQVSQECLWPVRVLIVFLGVVMAVSTWVALMPRRLLMAFQDGDSSARLIVRGILVWVIRAEDSCRAWGYECILRFASIAAYKQADARAYAVILPGDISTVGGSLGDQALLGGMVTGLQERGIGRAYVICRSGVVMPKRDDFEFIALPVWLDFMKSRQLCSKLLGAESLLVIGADVLDGFYSRFESVMRLRIANWAASLGCRTIICGFSFNDHPDPACVHAFARMSPRVSICCRDERSRQRLARAAGIEPVLTADLGFLMKPAEDSPADAQLSAWLAEVRATRAVGWNVSPHSLKTLSATEFLQAELACKDAISAIVRDGLGPVVLIPHDFRGHASDFALLARIHENLPEDVQRSVLLLSGPYDGPQIKRACRQLGFLISGRMHLMIAALGQEIPVAAIEYQGKFTGLFQLFGLGSENSISPADVCDSAKLISFVKDRLSCARETEAQIRASLPAVKQMAERNFVAWAR